MSRRLLTVIVFLSLAFNVAFLGYSVMRWHQAQHAPTHDQIINEREDSFAALLPAEMRDDLQKNLHERRGDIKSHMKTLKRLRTKIRKVMENEPIDDGALSKAFFDLREEHDMLQQIYHDAFIDVARKMDVKARKNVTKNLKSRHADGEVDDENGSEKD